MLPLLRTRGASERASERDAFFFISRIDLAMTMTAGKGEKKRERKERRERRKEKKRKCHLEKYHCKLIAILIVLVFLLTELRTAGFKSETPCVCVCVEVSVSVICF